VGLHLGFLGFAAFATWLTWPTVKVGVAVGDAAAGVAAYALPAVASTMRLSAVASARTLDFTRQTFRRRSGAR
jgi:hypothetical protein